MSKIAISIHGLSKSYGRVQALRNLELRVQEGEIFGFLGPNGAGKTTTIRCLLGLIYPQQGEMRVLGFDPLREPVAVRSRCGYLPGELNVDDNLSVKEVLRYFIQLRREPVNWKAVQELAERFDLDLNRLVKNLSKGNKQKVGLIQALVHRPQILLLDEPTSGLDPLMQQTVLDVVTEAKQAGTTVFFSSHILSEVQAIAERVGIIRQGSLIEIANTHDLLQRSLRRLRLRFQSPVDATEILMVPGVRLLGQPAPDLLNLEVSGDMDALVKMLANFPVLDLETERPSLEEVFLAYYREAEAPSGKVR